MAEGKKLGRPTACTPEVVDTICQSIRDGLPVTVAAELAGVSRHVIYDWEKRGKEGEEPFASFLHARAQATAEQIRNRLELMRDLPRDLWKREAWLLERMHPTIFAQVNKTQLSGPDGAPIQTAVAAQVVVVPEVAVDADAWVAAHKPHE